MLEQLLQSFLYVRRKRRKAILAGEATGLHKYENECWCKCFIENEAKAQGCGVA